MYFYNKNIAVAIVFITLFLLELSMPGNAVSQAPSNESIDTTTSSYFLGIFGGYNGLLKGSKLTENANGTDFIHGGSIGFSFDYKLPRTSSYIQVLTESTNLNFKSDSEDNYQTLRFTTVGLKMHPKILKNLYLSIGAGIMTGADIGTQMIMSMNLGYDIINEKHKSIFMQIGFYSSDFQDNFITFRFGYRLNL